MRRVVLAVLLCAAVAPATALEEREFRVLARVDSPVSEQTREQDERPAEVVLDFPKLLAEFGENLSPDLTTLRVVRREPDTDEPIPQAQLPRRGPENDVPWRWYDAAIGYDFPENAGNLDANDGRLAFNAIPRFGYFYNCIGDWRQGHLAFLHKAIGPRRETHYAIEFDALPEGAKPETPPRRGFLGDGLQRCAPTGASSTGLIHSRVDVADWDGDGRFDLIVGCARGGVVWYPNRGSEGAPRFPFSRLMRSHDARPIDIGWSATPHVVDWDGDGLHDMLVGGEWNRVVLFRNRGGPAESCLEPAGLLRTHDGEPLEVPCAPSPETQPHFTYTKDYYSVLETADWDDDGDWDLLAGGYVTGRVFLFENTAGPASEPDLRFVGPLEADGQALDVGWCAAPTVGDLDADGDLDLICGCMPMTQGGGDSSSSEHFLHYFRNDGTRADPRLHAMPLPRTGAFPKAALGTPRLIDWTGDGVLDLVVSAGTNIYLYRNVGTPGEPCFEAHSTALPSRWGSAALTATQFMDWNGDGRLDAIDAPRVALNMGGGDAGVFGQAASMLREGQVILHLSGIGDDWQYQRVYDLDGDGRLDLMDADHGGHFWWHVNRGKTGDPDFDSAGVRLCLRDGQPVVVGEARQGFNALQGARATYTVGDFDEDGLPDLVAADTFGVVRLFRQAARAESDAPPRFDVGVTIGKLGGRGAPYAADWDNDGHLDVVAASCAADAVVFLGRGREADTPFQPAQRVPLPSAPYGSGAPVVVVDYNGDGDQDLILYTPYGYMCFYEHSFIESGYLEAHVVAAERRQP